MFMSLIFTTVGPAADYGYAGRYILPIFTLSTCMNSFNFIVLVDMHYSSVCWTVNFRLWLSLVRYPHFYDHKVI